MKNYNTIHLKGYLALDPELQSNHVGKKFCHMSIAVEREDDGKTVDFHRVIAQGKLAEQCTEYLQKGKEVIITGQLINESYDTKEGERKFMTRITPQEITTPLPEPTREYIDCKNCGQGFPIEKMHELNGNYTCPDCYEFAQNDYKL